MAGKTDKPKGAGAKKAVSKGTKTKKTVAAQKPRRIKQGKYKSLRLQKRITHPIKLPSIYALTKATVRTMWAHKKLFIGIVAIYGLLNLFLVRGFTSNLDVTNSKAALEELAQGNFKELSASLSIFTLVLGDAGTTSGEAAGVYQILFAIIGSLAIIWALRQVLAGNTVRIRDAYYGGMYPLVPFVLVLLVVGLQFIPLLIGAGLYGIVTTNGIAIYPIEKILWALLYALTALLTLYMLSSSLFALYISTLNDMTPMKALRSARQLVRYRRWTVLRKIIVLPLIMLLAAIIIMLPVIAWLTPLTPWIFFILTMFSLLVIHTYMYTLYRELLRE